MKNKLYSSAVIAGFLLAATLASAGSKPLKAIKIPSSKISVVAELSGNLEYDFSRSAIRSVYYSKLNKLAQYLIANDAALTLRGFADSIGTFKGNWKLSEKRAVLVKSYLIKKGVKEDKIVTTAFGSTKPLTTNSTAQGRQKNRRVEIKINTVN